MSQRKLRDALADRRPVTRAVGFGPPNPPVPTGFAPLPVDQTFASGVTFAAAALELAAGASRLVLAPATQANVPLAHALRRAGRQVELAGLGTETPAGESVRRLGRDCLFVP